MYGFGGLGEVEVEIWSDVTIAGQTTDKKERQSYSAIGQWKAEMSNINIKSILNDIRLPKIDFQRKYKRKGKEIVFMNGLGPQVT